MSTWIPLHANVFFDPKVTGAAKRLTRGDVEKLVGHLARLWTWSIDHADTGDLSHLQLTAIASAAGWNGDARRFVKILLEVGLLDSGPRIHEADKYFGRIADRRKQDRERKKEAREAEKRAQMAHSSAGVSRGRPLDFRTLDDSDSDNDSEKMTTTLANADGDAEANVERALEVLRRCAWYPRNVELDRPLLYDATMRTPGQDLASDLRRFIEFTAKRGTPKRPHSALKGWLKNFGDQDRPIAPEDRIPSPELKLAQERWNREKSAESLQALRRARGAA